MLVPDNTLPGLTSPRAWRRRVTTGCVHHDALGCPARSPVWGVVTGQVLYLYSERRTVKARNLAADPRVVVHLESGEDVVIVRGTAKDLGTPAQVPDVVAARAAKYTGEDVRQYLPDADPDFDVVYTISPQSPATGAGWQRDLRVAGRLASGLGDRHPGGHPRLSYPCVAPLMLTSAPPPAPLLVRPHPCLVPRGPDAGLPDGADRPRLVP